MCCFDTLMQLYLIPNIRFIALFKQRYCEPFNCVAGASCIDFKIRRAGPHSRNGTSSQFNRPSQGQLLIKYAGRYHVEWGKGLLPRVSLRYWID